MLDGPVVAGMVFVGGAAVVGGYFYIEHLRHGRTARHAPRGAERLPLFGVDAPSGTSIDGAKPLTRMPRPDLGSRRPAGEVGSPRADQQSPPAESAAAPSAAPPLASAAFGPPQYGPPQPGTPAYGGSQHSPPLYGQPAYGTAQYAQAQYPQPAQPQFAQPLQRAQQFGAPHFGADPANGSASRSAPVPTSAPRYADGQTLRFALPDDGTLQFLPGRLQVIVGPETGREIRFVRSPNTPTTDVTFGRSEGPPHRHIQLLVPTVSRRHALMSLIDEHWSLQNLSATNPVTHNGRRLAPDEVVPLLVDGDRIEMGEVVFVFHSR